MKFGFIAKHRGIWPVAWLCAALGVSRSGFHAWLGRSPSARSRSDEAVGAKGRKEDLEIFRAAERALSDDRKLLVDAAVDDERFPHHPRRVGGKGAHFDVAHVDAVLGPDRGSERQQ